MLSSVTLPDGLPFEGDTRYLLKKAVEADNVDDMKNAMKAMENNLHAFAQEIYKNANPQGGPGGANPGFDPNAAGFNPNAGGFNPNAGPQGGNEGGKKGNDDDVIDV